ncbi:MAG: YdcF family protein, partial [Selenomonas sp.]|nr:YdcF family protein [Selenomonas sp.]
MIYILKFGAAWILPPGIFVLAMLGLAVYLWKRRHQSRAAVLLGALAAMLYLLSIGAVSDRLMGELERTYPVPEAPQGDVIIMLGGGAIADVQDVDGTGMLAQ